MKPTKQKCPYTFPHRSRKAMIDYLCNVGGYYAGRSEIYVLSYEVSACPDLTFEALLKCSGDVPAAPTPEWLMFAREIYERVEMTLWEAGIDGAQETVMGGDAYRMQWDAEAPFAIDFTFAGRGGKHLCIKSFEGVNLCLRGEEFGELLEARSFRWIRNLYKMCRQWEVDFSRKRVEAEVQYQAAFALFANHVEPEWEQHLEGMKRFLDDPAWVMRMHAMESVCKELTEELIVATSPTAPNDLYVSPNARDLIARLHAATHP